MKMYSKIRYAKYFSATIFVVFVFLVSCSNFAAASTGVASCTLTKVHISAGTMTTKSETVMITTTPSCWSGQVEVNRGNVDYHLITVTVTNGHGTGTVVRISVSQNVHPYAVNPGLRGNNMIVPPLA